MISPVPSRRNPDTCAASLLTVADAPQCRVKPTTVRDGYPCCRRHAKARFFVLWTGMTQLEAGKIYQRTIDQLRHPPEPLKLEIV